MAPASTIAVRSPRCCNGKPRDVRHPRLRRHRFQCLALRRSATPAGPSGSVRRGHRGPAERRHRYDPPADVRRRGGTAAAAGGPAAGRLQRRGLPGRLRNPWRDPPAARRLAARGTAGRHVRPRQLGPADPAIDPAARRVRHQAAVLQLPARARPAGLRLRAAGAAACSAAPVPTPRRSPRWSPPACRWKARPCSSRSVCYCPARCCASISPRSVRALPAPAAGHRPGQRGGQPRRAAR